MIGRASGVDAKGLRRRLEALAPRGACAAAALAVQRRGVGLERETGIVPHRALPPPALHAEALSGSEDRIAIAARAEGCASWACRAAAPQTPWASRTRTMRAELAASDSLERSCAAARDPYLPVALSFKAASHESRSVREAVASNELCPRQMLTLLSTDASMEVRRETASNERCPSLVLSRLCGDEAESVAYYAAANAKLPEAALRRAARSPRSGDRAGAARNPSCPQYLFEEMSYDDDAEVLQALAANTSCPPHLLAQMAEGANRFLDLRVAANPRATPQILKRIAARPLPAGSHVLVAVAANPNCDAELFDELANDRHILLRETVAANPNCPRHLLDRLAQDEEPDVCYEAAATIRAMSSTPPGG